jgi:transposase
MNDMQSATGTAAGSPDPEVTPKAKRRSFSAAYKKKILAEVDAAAGTGNIGEILRREGIYSSTLTGWRKERETAVDTAFSQKRGPEPKHNPLTAENEKLRRRNQRLEEELRKAEIIIDVQKKVAMLLGRPLAPVPENGNS